MAAASLPGATSKTTPRSGSENTVAYTKGLRTAHSSIARWRPRRPQRPAVARPRGEIGEEPQRPFGGASPPDPLEAFVEGALGTVGVLADEATHAKG